MPDPVEPAVVIPTCLYTLLGQHDDPELWEQVLKATADDVADSTTVEWEADLYAEFGRCSNWLRPHQTRWGAAGGFAWPTVYGDSQGWGWSRLGLPNFDW